jgi:hypothetical protein
VAQFEGPCNSLQKTYCEVGKMLADARTGKNGRHVLVGLLGQSVFGRSTAQWQKLRRQAWQLVLR